MTTFSAGCDGQVRMWNPSQGPNSVQIIGKHDQPVRSDPFHFNIKYMFIFFSFFDDIAFKFCSIQYNSIIVLFDLYFVFERHYG
jgi:hypothetical protein